MTGVSQYTARGGARAASTEDQAGDIYNDLYKDPRFKDIIARAGSDGATAIRQMLKTGDFTGDIGRALGISEDSPLVAAVLAARRKTGGAQSGGSQQPDLPPDLRAALEDIRNEAQTMNVENARRLKELGYVDVDIGTPKPGSLNTRGMGYITDAGRAALDGRRSSPAGRSAASLAAAPVSNGKNMTITMGAITINNPIVDTAARVEELKQAIIAATMEQVDRLLASAVDQFVLGGI
jgi:hypothetical protein